MCVHHNTHVEVRGQLHGVALFLYHMGTKNLNVFTNEKIAIEFLHVILASEKLLNDCTVLP